jgi:hypothetical protein
MAQRKYCSRRCRGLAEAPREYRCQVCRASFRAPAWRKPQFCSLSCTNHGRHRESRPELLARNARILELDAQGWRAKDIRRQLREDDPAWQAKTAVIYQVVSLAKRQGAPT